MLQMRTQRLWERKWFKSLAIDERPGAGTQVFHLLFSSAWSQGSMFLSSANRSTRLCARHLGGFESSNWGKKQGWVRKISCSPGADSLLQDYAGKPTQHVQCPDRRRHSLIRSTVARGWILFFFPCVRVCVYVFSLRCSFKFWIKFCFE